MAATSASRCAGLISGRVALAEKRSRKRFLRHRGHLRGEVGAQGFIHHVADDLARRVEGAEGLAGGGAGVFVVGGEEVFEDLAEQLGIEGDFLFQRSVFLDGEFVAGEDFDEAADFRALRAGGAFVFLAIVLREIDGALRTEEEIVRQMAGLVRIVGKAVEDGVIRFLPVLSSRQSKRPPFRNGTFLASATHAGDSSLSYHSLETGSRSARDS